MLIFSLISNVPPNKITPNLMGKASEMVAYLFDEKEKNVLVSIKAGVDMYWGSTPAIIALGTVQNTDPMRTEDTNCLAPVLFEFCEKELTISQNRMYIGCFTINPENVAFGGEICSIRQND